MSNTDWVITCARYNDQCWNCHQPGTPETLKEFNGRPLCDGCLAKAVHTQVAETEPEPKPRETTRRRRTADRIVLPPEARTTLRTEDDDA